MFDGDLYSRINLGSKLKVEEAGNIGVIGAGLMGHGIDSGLRDGAPRAEPAVFCVGG